MPATTKDGEPDYDEQNDAGGAEHDGQSPSAVCGLFGCWGHRLPGLHLRAAANLDVVPGGVGSAFAAAEDQDEIDAWRRSLRNAEGGSAQRPLARALQHHCGGGASARKPLAKSSGVVWLRKSCGAGFQMTL